MNLLRALTCVAWYAYIHNYCKIQLPLAIRNSDPGSTRLHLDTPSRTHLGIGNIQGVIAQNYVLFAFI